MMQYRMKSKIFGPFSVLLTARWRKDKFAAFGLTVVPATQVAAPLIAERYANLECRVVDAALVAGYNFCVLEVVKAWIDPQLSAPRTPHHRGRGESMVAGRTLRLRSRAK